MRPARLSEVLYFGFVIRSEAQRLHRPALGWHQFADIMIFRKNLPVDIGR